MNVNKTYNGHPLVESFGGIGTRAMPSSRHITDASNIETEIIGLKIS